MLSLVACGGPICRPFNLAYTLSANHTVNVLFRYKFDH